jgi:SAM-dependent methyltransferase
MHKNSINLFNKYAAEFFSPDKTVLEVGPDAFPSTYQKLVNGKYSLWHTLDIRDQDRLTYCHPPNTIFPAPEDTYDIVLSGQVLEHVPAIWDWITDLASACKPGGEVIIIAPTNWPYHEAPFDCWRVFPDGMRGLFEHARLKVQFVTCESDSGEHVENIGNNFAGFTSSIFDTIIIGRKQ